MAMQTLVRVATFSIAAKPGALEHNLACIEQAAADAQQQQVDLLLFPELSLTGFIPNHPTGDHQAWLRQALRGARDMAVPLDGPWLARLATIAGRHTLYLSVGLLEDAGNRLFNTQVLVGPEGLVGSWRKMHVPMFEMPFYEPGDVPPVVETRLGRIGVNICFDALLPESTRLLAAQNVEIVLFPFAADPPPVSVQAWRDWSYPALHCRCQENGVFGIACNYFGEVNFAGVSQNFPGGSLILDPRGNIVAATSDLPTPARLLVASLSRDDLTQARAEPEYLYRFRRPELYRGLSSS